MALQAEFKKRPKKPKRHLEQAMCQEFCFKLGLLNPDFLWWHTLNEQTGGKRLGGIYKSMGVRAGVLDYAFLSRKGLYFLEAKSEERRRAKNGGLSDSQVRFCAELTKIGILWGVFYTPEEGIEKLKRWELL